MCGEDHNFRLCRAQDGAHRGLAGFRVEAGERLVERERVGRREQRSSECQPALHAAGIIAYLLFPHVAKSQFFQERLRRCGVVIRAEDEAKISLCVQPFEQAVFLKARRPAKFIAVDRAAVRRFQQSYDVQESCFSGSAFALDGDKLSGFNMQRVIPKQDFIPEAFIDIG